MSTSDSVTPRLFAESLPVAENNLHVGCRSLFRHGFVRLEQVADFLTSAFGFLAACCVAASQHGGRLQVPLRDLEILSIGAGLFIVLLLQRDGAYSGGGSLLRIRETESALRIPVQSLACLLPFRFFFHPNLPYAAFLIALLLVPGLLILQKQIFLLFARALRQQEDGLDRVAVYGAADTDRRIISALLHSLRLGLRPVAVIHDDPATDRSCIFEMGYSRTRSVPVWPGPITPTLLQACRCQLLMVVAPNLSSRQVAAAEQAAEHAGVKIAFLSGAELQERLWTESIDLDGLSITSTTGPSASWLYLLRKRCVDLVVASLLLVAVAPLFGLIALLVRLDSPGPALFVQKRVGRNGELFSMYKFRSMDRDAPRYGHSPRTSRDPRITRMGRLLRRTSLDELPQLINVVLGNMSLVGPRPEMPFIVQHYRQEHRQRLQVSPGITGLWQLSADRAFPIHESPQYDLYYIRKRGFFMDMAILIHTLFFAMWGGI